MPHSDVVQERHDSRELTHLCMCAGKAGDITWEHFSAPTPCLILLRFKSDMTHLCMRARKAQDHNCKLFSATRQRHDLFWGIWSAMSFVHVCVQKKREDILSAQHVRVTHTHTHTHTWLILCDIIHLCVCARKARGRNCENFSATRQRHDSFWGVSCATWLMTRSCVCA